jgi:hypothetical protein
MVILPVDSTIQPSYNQPQDDKKIKFADIYIYISQNFQSNSYYVDAICVHAMVYANYTKFIFISYIGILNF